ncbi:MAG: DMT family transporter [Pyrinomonadaceae bacterium]
MEAQERSTAPFLALIPAQVFFGSLPVIGKIVLAVLPPMALVGIRTSVTAIILIAVQAFRRRIWLKERGDYLKLAILSLFGVVFNQLFFISGLSLTSASNTSLLAVMIPVFALTVGAVAGFERLTWLKILGIIVAALGVIILLDPRKASFSSQTTLGDLCIVINCLAYGIYVATSKSVIVRNGTFRSMMWVFIFGAIVCAPLGAVSLSRIDLTAVPAYVWWVSVYIAIGATAAPYLLNAWALQKVEPSTVAVYVYLQPLIGFVLAVLFLGESLTLTFGIAAAFVFAGVFMVTHKYVPLET